MVQWLTYSLLSSTFLFKELKLNRNIWCFCIILFTYKDTDLFYVYILYTYNRALKVGEKYFWHNSNWKNKEKISMHFT